MTDFTLDNDTENDEDVVDDEDNGNDGETFKIFVNGEVVWESEGNAMLVDRVSVYRAAGEATAIGSPGTDEWLKIEVNERSYDAPETYLDIIEDRQRRERRERFEPESSAEREGYVEADPETGEPMNQEEDKDNEEEDVEVQTQEEQKNEKAMAGDIEF